MVITVQYTACDGSRLRRRFKTLKGARYFAQLYVGAHPEIGPLYAVSGDGVGRIEVEGCSLADLFPKE